MPLAPPPQRRVTSSSFSIFEKALPSRTTTPGTPPSRTIMLEPRPSAITGTSRSRSRRSPTRSCSSVGSNSHCAVPPLLNQTNGASGASGVSLPRTCGSAVTLTSWPCAGQMPSASPAAHLVMSPAPMQMMRSPGAARSRSARAQIIEVADRPNHAVAVGAQSFDQSLRIHAFDRLLARRIDRRHEHDVGVVEGVLEVLHQIVEPRETMRLHHRDDPFLGTLASRRQHGADLDRMMRVVVDDRASVDLADLAEAALHAVEPGEALRGSCRRKSQARARRRSRRAHSGHCAARASARRCLRSSVSRRPARK